MSRSSSAFIIRTLYAMGLSLPFIKEHPLTFQSHTNFSLLVSCNICRSRDLHCLSKLPTDLAVSHDLMDPWTGALLETGFDPTDFVPQYTAIQALYEIQEEAPEPSPSGTGSAGVRLKFTPERRANIYHRLGGLFKTKEQLQNQNDSNPFREPQ
jgi:hypothetical protein